MDLFAGRRKPGWMAIAMGDGRIRAAHAHAGVAGKPQVTLCEIFDDRGDPLQALSALRRRLGLARYRVSLLLSPRDYQFVQIERPPVEAAELKSAAAWAVKDLTDIPPERATLDVLPVPMPDQLAGRTPQLLVACAENETLARHIQLFQRARIRLERIDIPECAQRNISAVCVGPEHCVAMLGFGEQGGMLTFTRGGELFAARRLELTQAQVNDALASNQHGVLDRIVLEIQRSLDNFQNKYHVIPVARLLLAPLEQGEALRAFLAENLDLAIEPVWLPESLDCAAVPGLVNGAMQSQCLGVLGAALRMEAA